MFERLTYAALLTTLLLSGTGLAAAESIALATEGAYPPFNATNGDGTFSGFEIDYGNAVCAKAELECTWVKQDFSGMIPALLSGKFDAIFSALSVNAEREKAGLFSLPYLDDGFRFYGPKGGAVLEGDGSGRQIGVLTGSTGERFVQERWPAATVKGYGDMDQMNADLDAGRIDYGFNAQLPVSTFLKTPAGAAFDFVGPVFSDPVLGRGMAVLTRKDAMALKAKFDEAIRATYADGTFDKLAAQHFGQGVNVRADKLW